MADIDPKTLEKLNQELARNKQMLQQVADVGQRFSEIFKGFGKTEGIEKSSKALSSYSRDVSALTKKYKENVEGLYKSGQRSREEYLKLMKFVRKYREELSEPISMVMELESKNSRKKKAAREDVAEYVGGRARGVVGGAMGAVGMGSKTMSAAADAFAGTWKQGKMVKESFTGLTDMMKVAGKGAGMFSGAISLLGHALKANPIMLIVSAIQMVASVVNEFDQMIKGLNKSWKEMAGSPALIKDIRGSMKAFNDSIFNLDRNMRLGLKASNIQEFFKTMSSAGLTTEGVSKRVGDFNSAIETGYEMSLKFGVSFSEMGSMMANQMVDLRSSLDDVSEAFKGMSYDAAVAGVQSQKFYQVVESASMSLSFYGNFLESTSKRLRDFVQTGVMGFKDASQTVQDLANTFKGMGMDQRRALVNIIGEGEVTSMFQDRLKEMNDEITKQSSKVMGLAGGGNKKEFEAAKMRLDAMRGDARNLREALRTGDVTALGSMLEVLSDKVLGAAAKVLERTGINFFEDKAAAFQVLQQQFGWSIDMVNKSFKKANVSIDIMHDTLKPLGSIMESASDETKDAYAKLSKNVRDYAKDPATSPYSSFEKMMDDVKKTFGDLNLAENVGGPLIDLLSQSEIGFSDFLDKVLGKSGKTLENIATGAAIGTRARDVVGEQEKQMDDLIKQTTPIADYLEIGKENVKYALASSNLQNTIALGVTATARSAGGIFKFLSGMWGRQKGGKGRVEEYKKEESKVKSQMARAKMLEKLIEMASDKNIDVPDREKMLEGYKKEQDYITGELEKTSNKFSDVQLEINRTQDAALADAGKWAENIDNAKKVMSEQGKTYADIQDRINKGLGVGYASEEERLNLIKNQAEAAKLYNEQAAKLEGHLMEAGGKAMEAGSRGKAKSGESAGEFQSANLFGATPLVIPEVKDFLAKTGGLVNVSAGDRIVNDRSLAKGIAMGRGQMVNQGAGIMKGGGSSFSMGNVVLNFNAPVNGNPEEYRKMFIEAVNDVVNKRLYQEKARVS